MLNLLMRYGGTAAKVRVMYGKRLRPADFQRLIYMKSVNEAVEFLRQTPGWGDALRAFSSAGADSSQLEKALGAAVRNEFVRIYKFMSREDHPLMRGMLDRAEQDEILSFIRLWNAGTLNEYICSLPEFFKTHTAVAYDELSTAVTPDGFWNAISSSEYSPALSRLPRNQGFPPDYTLSKTVMDTQYYSKIFKIIDKSYSGDTAAKLGEGFGAEVDLLNIITIARVKLHFPSMSDAVADYLLPQRHRIRPPLLRAMLDAPDGETVIALAKTSPYRKLFTGARFDIIDDYLQKHLYEFNRRVLAAPVPSVYTPLAYLHLKELELSNIIKIIECIRYGTTPKEAGVYLAGLDK